MGVRLRLGMRLGMRLNLGLTDVGARTSMLFRFDSSSGNRNGCFL